MTVPIFSTFASTKFSIKHALKNTKNVYLNFKLAHSLLNSKTFRLFSPHLTTILVMQFSFMRNHNGV